MLRVRTAWDPTDWHSFPGAETWGKRRTALPPIGYGDEAVINVLSNFLKSLLAKISCMQHFTSSHLYLEVGL